MNINQSAVSAALNSLGGRLRRARLAANLTQKDLSELAGVSLKTVTNAEDGRNVSLETFAALLAGVGRLNELDALIASDGPSPVELARRRGRQRQRASGTRGGGDGDDWTW